MEWVVREELCAGACGQKGRGGGVESKTRSKTRSKRMRMDPQGLVKASELGRERR